MKKLGEILIEHGTVTQGQLEEALALQKKTTGKLIGEILIELSYVSEEDIVVALATQFNVPYLPIGNFTLNENADQWLPPELMQKYRCVPLDRIGNLLTVVMADPADEAAIQEIEQVTKCRVQAFVASPTEIVKAIEQNFNIKIAPSSKPGEPRSGILFGSAVKQKTQKAQ